MTKSLTRALALIVALSGCSLIDTTDGPAITFEDRLCNTDSDCIGLEDTLVDLDGITTRPCIVIGTECNTSRNRCIVTVEEVSDVDGDGEAAMACGGNDCDDTRSTVKPGAREACDGFVSDCAVANGGTARTIEDADGDLFSASDAPCEPGGFPKTDCDDTNPNTFPAAPEVCDGEINTCETLGARALEDMDGDAHAAPDADCLADIGNANVFAKDDCDDTNPSTYPDAPEVCDRIFNDCSSTMPRIVEDADNDGRASFLASCSGGPIPKDECVGADLDATTRYCTPTETASVGFPNAGPVAVIDADGAGGLDIVVASNAADGELRRCLNSGGAEPVLSCTVLNAGFDGVAKQFRVANIDNVGRLDVVYSASTGIGWFPSTGVAATVLAAAGPAFNVADFDGDGVTDVIVVSGTTIVLRTNDGVGNFTSTVVDAAITNPRAVASADFNGDGARDVVATANGGVFVYMTAGGVSGVWTESTLTTTVAGPVVVEAGDLDDDGDSDFVVGNTNSGEVGVYLSNAGVFTEVPVVPATSPQQRLPGIETIVLRDFDLDGDLDIGATSANEDSVVWWETAGSSIWFRHDIVTDLDAVGGLAVGDLDGDGDEDLVASSISGGTVSWWRSHYVSDVRFTEQRVDRAYDNASDAVLGDLDGDGDLDIVAVSAGGGDVSAWINVDGRGTVLAEIGIDLAFPSVRNLALGDFDGDDDLDIVAISPTAIRWWQNTASTGRTWSAANVVATGLVGLQSVAVADLDAASSDDFVVSSSGAGGTVTRYMNDGAGAFISTSIDVVNDAREVAVGDVDGDGDVDVAVASAGGSEVLLFANGGSASSFVRSTISMTPLATATGVSLGDLDRDGRLDVVAIGLAGEIRLIRNTTSGFVEVLVAGAVANSGSVSVDVGDLDSDGDLDVVATFQNQDFLRWYESTARDGTVWIAHEVADVPTTGPSGFDVGDVDLDGNLDVVSALRFANDVLWWRSNGAAWWNP